MNYTVVRTNQNAVISLVFGILCLFGIGSLIAVITGHRALREIETSYERGNGLAIAGLCLGYVGLVAMGILLLSVGPESLFMILFLGVPIAIIIYIIRSRNKLLENGDDS